MTGDTHGRKLQHIQIVNRDPGADRKKGYFDEIRLTHRALPELALDRVDSGITFLGRRLSFPLLISSMTGGGQQVLRRINRRLAAAAEAEQVAMSVGSQRVMFSRPAARSAFVLRGVAPTTLLFANLGAVQLNYGFSLAHCREAVAVLGADALCLHLNPLQEAIQPEGQTHFAGLSRKMGRVAAGLKVPVIAKEVGAGLSLADARRLVAAGVRILDVAGAGGTSWSRVEHQRHRVGTDSPGLVFQDWGLPTPLALQALRLLRPRATLIASGGIRTGLDMVKAMVLGASLCGVASPFLQPALESTDAVRALIQRLRREFVIAMFLLGIGRAKQLVGNTALLATNGAST